MKTMQPTQLDQTLVEDLTKLDEIKKASITSRERAKQFAVLMQETKHSVISDMCLLATFRAARKAIKAIMGHH
jgi:hypothetical protein